MHRLRFLLIAMLAATACETRPRADGRQNRVSAATMLTARYARPPFDGWKIRVDAAGQDCDVLVVNARIILEESMVGALHAGTGPYAVTSGGLRRFSADRAFRTVAYRDATGRVWAYGPVTAEETLKMRPCQ